MRQTRKLALLFSLVLGAAGAMHADTVLSTLPQWDGNAGFDAWGPSPGATPTFGQVITAPTDNILESFTFEIVGGSNQTTYNAEVYAWNGSSATGPALYVSPAATVDTNYVVEAVTANTGGVALTAGQEYVLLFTVTDADAATSSGNYSWGTVSGASSGSDGMVFDNVSPDSPLFTTTAWYSGDDPDQNFAYSADFASAAVAATPEPASLTLLGSGMLALAAVARRRLRTL